MFASVLCGSVCACILIKVNCELNKVMIQTGKYFIGVNLLHTKLGSVLRAPKWTILARFCVL